MYHDDDTTHPSQYLETSRETNFVLPGCDAFYVKTILNANTRGPGKKPGPLLFYTLMNIQNTLNRIRYELYDVRNSLTPWFNEDNDVLNFKPNDEAWSVRQILEHIVLTSHYLLLLIDKASEKSLERARKKPIDIDWTKYTLTPVGLEDVGVHRSFSWTRPDHMEPTGNLDLNSIRERMMSQFNRCEHQLDLLSNGEGVLCYTMMSVNGIGKLDVYQYIYFLVLHAKRHLTQMENNRIEFNVRDYVQEQNAISSGG